MICTITDVSEWKIENTNKISKYSTIISYSLRLKCNFSNELTMKYTLNLFRDFFYFKFFHESITDHLIDYTDDA